MRRLILLVILAALVGGCASHTEFGGKRFGHTFGWGEEASSGADPYSLETQDPARY